MERGNESAGGSGTSIATGDPGSSVAPGSAPCKICGEPRGNAPTCPHCGMQ